MITVYIYFASSLFSFYLFLFFVHLYKKNKTPSIFNYSLLFLSIFFIFFFNSVPILAGLNPRLVAWGNVMSNISVFTLFFSCFRVQMLVTGKYFKKNLIFFDITTFVIGTIAIGNQIAFLKDPVIHSIGVVWNLNIITIVLMSVSSFVYGMYWTWLFGKVAYILRERALKLRMYILSINGFLDGVGALFLFLNNDFMVLIGIIIIFMAIIMSVFIFIVPEEAKTIKGRLITLKQ